MRTASRWLMPGSLGSALDRDEFAREVRAFRRQLARAVLLRYFQPQRDGLADIRQRLRVRGTLRMAAGERRTGNGEPFLRLNDDNMVLHGRSFARAPCERQEFFTLVAKLRTWPRRICAGKLSFVARGGTAWSQCGGA